MAGHSEPKFTTAVTASQLESFANDLQTFAQQLHLAAKVARSQKDETIAVFNWASGLNGIKSIRGFVARVDESRSASELGRPLAVGELKPRSTGKQKGVEDAQKFVDQIQSAIKPRRKKSK